MSPLASEPMRVADVVGHCRTFSEATTTVAAMLAWSAGLAAPGLGAADGLIAGELAGEPVGGDARALGASEPAGDSVELGLACGPQAVTIKAPATRTTQSDRAGGVERAERARRDQRDRRDQRGSRSPSPRPGIGPSVTAQCKTPRSGRPFGTRSHDPQSTTVWLCSRMNCAT